MFYRVLTAVLVLSLLCQSKVSTAQPNQRQTMPNVVMILGDDQAWSDYGFMGHPQIQTPSIDRLASQSAVFRRGYVPTALCRPSLATIVSGLYAHQHRITGNDPSPESAPANSKEYAKLRESLISLSDSLPTLPRILKQHGYLSHQSGKWWEGSFARGGFTHGMTQGFPNPQGRHGDAGLSIGREGMQPIFDFIEQSQDQNKPFFIWYAPFLPHTPHNPPERLLEKYRQQVASPQLAKYYAMCEWFDETVGQLVDHLQQLDVAQNTIFVFLADNGWIQQVDGAGYAERSKQSPHEGGVRQPIMIRWDRRIRPGDYHDLVSSIDILPTLLSGIGIEPHPSVPGINLLPLLMNGQLLQRDAIFGEGFSHDIMDIEEPEATLLYRWVIRGQWKLILTYDGHVGSRYASSHPRTERRPQLFDLLTDPYETKNLAAENPTIVAELAQLIGNWWPVKNRKCLESFD